MLRLPTRTTFTACAAFALLTGCASHSLHAPRTTSSVRNGHDAFGSTTAAPALQASSGGIRQPGGMAYLRGGLGTAELEVNGPGATATNDTDAAYAEFGVEATGKVVGGGVRLSGYMSDDDLLETTPGFDTSVSNANFFPHLTIRPTAGRFRIPIRIGPEVRVHSVDVSGVGAGMFLSSEVEWRTLGGAIEIEPEIDFVRTGRTAFSLYGRLHGGGGIAEASSSTTDFDTDSINLSAEIGLRLQLAKFLLSAGYMQRETRYSRSDLEDLNFVEESTWSFEGAFLAMGVRW